MDIHEETAQRVWGTSHSNCLSATFDMSVLMFFRPLFNQAIDAILYNVAPRPEATGPKKKISNLTVYNYDFTAP